MQAVMAMPDIVVQALALALRYLRQFGLEKVLQMGASFRSFAGHSEMSLSPNALRQLEVFTSVPDNAQPFHVLNFQVTKLLFWKYLCEGIKFEYTEIVAHYFAWR